MKFTLTSVFVKSKALLQRRFSITGHVDHVDFSLISTPYEAKMAKSNPPIPEKLTEVGWNFMWSIVRQG